MIEKVCSVGRLTLNQIADMLELVLRLNLRGKELELS